MGNFLKGVLYTAIAGATGVAGYMIGKYKHMKGVSLTMVGLALVLYAPKGCDVLETYMKTKAQTEQVRIYGTFRKDSLDRMIRNEELQDSASYLKKMLDDARDARKNLESTYKRMIVSNQSDLQRIIDKNDAAYERALDELKRRNLQLEKGILAIEEQKKVAENILSTTRDSLKKDREGAVTVRYEGYGNRPMVREYIGQRTLPGGGVETTYREEDGSITKQYTAPPTSLMLHKDDVKRRR